MKHRRRRLRRNRIYVRKIRNILEEMFEPEEITLRQDGSFRVDRINSGRRFTYDHLGRKI